MKQPLKHATEYAARILRPALFLLVLLIVWTAPAVAQGCAMCYTTAAAASKDGQMAIDRAVAVLLAPPLGFMTLGVGLAFRYGKKRDSEHSRDDSTDL